MIFRRWQVAYRDVDGRLIKASPHFLWRSAQRERLAKLRIELLDGPRGIPPLYSAVIERRQPATPDPGK